ncbi:MAG: porin family protein [Muribaculaceae bacterium]|nr:porin family protein [Muribaculaceae bacterium]
MKKGVLLILLASLYAGASQKALAQEDYRFDAGGGIGMTGYLGDANTASLWSHPGADGMLLFRYIRNPRIAFKTGLYVGTLSGDTEDMTDVLPDAAQFKFSTTFFELSEMFEFNFFNYGMGERYRKLKRWSPYITGGVGATVWTTDGYTGAAFTLPFGIGAKYKINRRLNLGLEFLMKKTFSDRLDGRALSDPHSIKSGFAKNTDWYSTLTVTLSYEFSKRCATCNYKE